MNSQAVWELVRRAIVVRGTQVLIAVIVGSLGLIYPAYRIDQIGEGSARNVWIAAFVVGGIIYGSLWAYLVISLHSFKVEIDAKLNLVEGDSPQDPNGLDRIVHNLRAVRNRVGRVGVSHLVMIKWRPDTDVQELLDKLRTALTIAQRLQRPGINPTQRSVDINTFERTYGELKQMLKNAGDPSQPLGVNLWHIKYFYHRFLWQCLSVHMALSGFFAFGTWFGWWRNYPTY